MKSLLLLSVLAACGSSDADLSCAVLADPTNCWADTSAQLAACMPARATPAQMTADRKKCTFTDDAFITFDEALPNNQTNLLRIAFTAYTPDGAFCGRFVDTFTSHLELTANGSSEIAERQPDNSFQLRCMDGQHFSTDFSDLLKCSDGGGPTDDYALSSTMFSFSLVSIATPGPLFTCQR